jgi:hypothetical protein
MIGKPAKNRRWTSSRQDPPGDEQKSDTRPTTLGERAADREAEPEERAQVDQALGRGQITCLAAKHWLPSEASLIWGDLDAYPSVGLARKAGRMW